MKKTTKKPIEILIVDDNDDLRLLMRNWLRRAGFVVHLAPHASEALRCVAGHPGIALTISDLNMPEESGVDLYRLMKSQGYSKPFILVTANASVRKADVLAIGINEFLPKPFPCDAFLACVHKVLSGPSHSNIKAS